MENQASSGTDRPPSWKVQSVDDWPLPTVDCKVANNELYSPTTHEEFHVIDSTSETIFEQNEVPHPPFRSLMAPISKSWYNDNVNNNKDSANASEINTSSPDSRKSFCSAKEDEISEENYYMSMYGGQKLTDSSPSSHDADTGNLSTKNVSDDALSQKNPVSTSDNFVQSENPYLVMSNPKDIETQETESLREPDLYMNTGQMCGTS